MDAFQSTPPARGATVILCVSSKLADVSIHAPRKGSDLDSATVFSYAEFQSTPPARGATKSVEDEH